MWDQDTCGCSDWYVEPGWCMWSHLRTDPTWDLAHGPMLYPSSSSWCRKAQHRCVRKMVIILSDNKKIDPKPSIISVNMYFSWLWTKTMINEPVLIQQSAHFCVRLTGIYRPKTESSVLFWAEPKLLFFLYYSLQFVSLPCFVFALSVCHFSSHLSSLSSLLL